MNTKFVIGVFTFAAVTAMFAEPATAQVLKDGKYTFTNAKSANGAVAYLYTTLHLDRKAPHPFRKGEEVGIYRVETNIGWMYADKNTPGTVVNMRGQDIEQASLWMITPSSKGWNFVLIGSGENAASLEGIKPGGGDSATGVWKLRRANGGGNGQNDQLFEMKEGHIK